MVSTTLILALAAFVGVGVVAFLGLGGVRILAQQTQDRLRRHYVLTFPRDIPVDAVAAFIRTLGGLSGSPLSRLNGLPSVVFEVSADETGVEHRIHIPVKVADYVVAQIRGHMPGVRLTPERFLEHEDWSAAVELSMTSGTVPLRLTKPEHVISTLLSALVSVKPKQKVMMQWVVAPALAQRPDPQDKQQREKQNDHTFLAVGRIAAIGEDRDAARRLIYRVFVGMGSLKTYGVSFTTRSLPNKMVVKRVNRRSASVAFPCLLNVMELAAVTALPVGDVRVAGLPQGSSRQLAADPGIPSTGFVIGMSNFPGGERPLALSLLDRTKHLHLTGGTGVGKTTVIENLATSEMAQGFGLAVIDPNGDLFQNLCDLVPEDRLNDVVIFDPTDGTMPVGLNVLEGDNPYLTTDRILAVFDGLYGLRSMPRSYDVAQNALLLAAIKGFTLMDLPDILAPGERGKDIRYEITRGLPPQVRQFWQTFDTLKEAQQIEWTAPLLHRLNPFRLRPSLRAALGQANSSLKIDEVLKTNKILLANLSKGALGEDTSALFAALIVSQIWQSAQARSQIAPEARQFFGLHLDEFHNYTKLPVNFETVLAEARKYKIGITLSHQNLGQLSPSLRDGLLANARSRVMFQSAGSDATALSRELSPYVSSQDIQNLEPYEAVVRVTGHPPATLTTSPPPKPLGTAAKARAASRANYGRPMAEVEAEIDDRFKTTHIPKQKANVGREVPE